MDWTKKGIEQKTNTGARDRLGKNIISTLLKRAQAIMFSLKLLIFYTKTPSCTSISKGGRKPLTKIKNIDSEGISKKGFSKLNERLSPQHARSINRSNQ